MHYQISRNGQLYGPYTLADLERYLASGHVLPTDLAKSEETPDWLPVSAVLAGSSASAAPASETPVSPASGGYPPAYPPAGYPPAYAQAAPTDGPPNLHWGLLLLFDLLTCSLFQIIWNLVLASWFKRVAPPSKALWLYIASTVLLVLQAATSQATGLLHGHHTSDYGYITHPGSYGTYGFIALICWVVRLITRFTFRAELEHHFNQVEPIGLQLNPVLTFFFGGLYFQSQMNRINAIRQGTRFR